MPRRRREQSYESLLTDMVSDAIIEDSDRMAAESGPPTGRRMSEAEEVRLWGLKDPSVDHDTLLDQLQTQGLGEMAQSLKVVEENPDLAAVYAAPVADPETADALATLAEYPFRASLWNHLGVPQDRVETANRIRRAWEKTQPQPVEEPDPMVAYPPAPGQEGV